MGKDKRKKSRKAAKLIALNTAFVIFSLASAITGTYAWFNANRTTSATAGSFAITAPDGLNYDLYYLNHFTDNSVDYDGNWNSSISAFAGYEVDSYSEVTFTQVSDSYGENDHNPLEIDQLWPAHKLTFAIVIDNGQTFEKLTLKSWSESTNDDYMISSTQHVNLSWAIDIYGKPYKLTPTSSIVADIATAFASYRSTTIVSQTTYDDPSEASHKNSRVPDIFDYDEDHLATVDQTEGVVISNSEVLSDDDAIGSGSRAILFFTIEFSNSSTTFYSLGDDGYYSLDSSYGNSNCYERLRLTSLVFSIS